MISKNLEVLTDSADVGRALEGFGGWDTELSGENTPFYASLVVEF